MENMQEVIPFIKEMLSQKPSCGLVRVYLVGFVFAVLGTVIGLGEAVCHPFSSGETLDAEMVLMMAREQRTVEAEIQHGMEGQEEEEEEEKEEMELVREDSAANQTTTIPKSQSLSQRNIANRLHAS